MKIDNLTVANQSIFESCPGYIIRVTEDNRIIQISPDLCTLLFINENYTSTDPQVSSHPLVTKLLTSSASVEITTEDNTLYQFSHSFFDNNTDDTRTHIFTNISIVLDLYGENQRLMEEARQLQLIDTDTSLLTQRALLLVMESQLSQCRRYETPLSVIKLNINFDTDCADFKLKLLKITHLLKDQLRWSDMIARSGSKQFTILLPTTDKHSSLQLINKLKQVIGQWHSDYSVSFGISEWNKNMSSSELLDDCEQSLINSITTSTNNGQDVA
ncbi:MAG: diguanylate cyclase [Gammaproteobacteria bacterium]|nr:diguanylate cyclase [Gammaproteobacteria bacterium]